MLLPSLIPFPTASFSQESSVFGGCCVLEVRGRRLYFEICLRAQAWEYRTRAAERIHLLCVFSLFILGHLISVSRQRVHSLMLTW